MKYDHQLLLLYLEKKLSPDKRKEVERSLKKDPLLLAHLMNLTRVQALTKTPETVISLRIVGGEEKIFTLGAVKLIRRDKVMLRNLPRPMIHSRLQSLGLKIGITKTDENYILTLSGKPGEKAVLLADTYCQNILFSEVESFFQLTSGIYYITYKKEKIKLFLA